SADHAAELIVFRHSVLLREQTSRLRGKTLCPNLRSNSSGTPTGPCLHLPPTASRALRARLGRGYRLVEGFYVDTFHLFRSPGRLDSKVKRKFPAAGQVINGTRGPLGPNFHNDDYDRLRSAPARSKRCS